METRSRDFVHQPNIRTATCAPPAYLSMLLSLEAVPRLHNVLACVFSFVLLVGFAIVPGAFPVSSSAAAANEAVTIGGFILVGVGLSGCMLSCFSRFPLQPMIHLCSLPRIEALSLSQSSFCQGDKLICLRSSDLACHPLASKLCLAHKQDLPPAAARRAGRDYCVAGGGV